MVRYCNYSTVTENAVVAVMTHSDTVTLVIRLLHIRLLNTPPVVRLKSNGADGRFHQPFH